MGELSITRSDHVAFINVSDVNGNGGGTLIMRGLTSDPSGVPSNAYAPLAVSVQGTLTQTSDVSLKKNIKPLENQLEKVLSLKPVSFNWKVDNKSDIGLIAQDVEKVYPELVSTDKTTGLKSLEYSNLVAPLIESVKEQQDKIIELIKFK